MWFKSETTVSAAAGSSYAHVFQYVIINLIGNICVVNNI